MVLRGTIHNGAHSLRIRLLLAIVCVSFAVVVLFAIVLYNVKVPNHDIYPQVWSENSWNFQSYEFKVNCGSGYSTLDTCFLWNLTNVTVTNPNGMQFQLSKDFNINNYSGEVTRRWVLYGPADGGLPILGVYTFDYYRNGTLLFTQKVNYAPQVIGFPTNVTYRIIGDNLSVNWTAPQGMEPGMWYKVLLFTAGAQIPISNVFSWNATSAVLPNIPLPNGTNVTLNVAAYFNDGYSNSEPLYFEFNRTIT